MTFKYREGRVHLNADPLSRPPLPECNNITTTTLPEEFVNAITHSYPNDPYFRRVTEGPQEDPPLREFDGFTIQKNGLITYSDPSDDHLRVCVPTDLENPRVRVNIIHDFHDASIAGH